LSSGINDRSNGVHHDCRLPELNRVTRSLGDPLAGAPRQVQLIALQAVQRRRSLRVLTATPCRHHDYGQVQGASRCTHLRSTVLSIEELACSRR
jgi:hypothetical protein